MDSLTPAEYADRVNRRLAELETIKSPNPFMMELRVDAIRRDCASAGIVANEPVKSFIRQAFKKFGIRFVENIFRPKLPKEVERKLVEYRKRASMAAEL